MSILLKEVILLHVFLFIGWFILSLCLLLIKAISNEVFMEKRLLMKVNDLEDKIMSVWGTV